MGNLDPNLWVPVMLFVVGYALARWDKRGDKQDNVSTSAAVLESRISKVEEWQRQHASVQSDLSGLFTKVDGIVDALSKLTDRFDEWIDQGAPMSRQTRMRRK